MLFRLVLSILVYAAFTVPVRAGFRRPTLPNDSRAIYALEQTHTASLALKAQSGAQFSLAVGFDADLLNSRSTASSHRQRAEQLLDVLSQKLVTLDLPQTDIVVSKVYSPTSEVILNVSVNDANAIESTKAKLVDFITKISGVSFVDEPKYLRID
jgi:hypothetical protein